MPAPTVINATPGTNGVEWSADNKVVITNVEHSGIEDATILVDHLNFHLVVEWLDA